MFSALRPAFLSLLVSSLHATAQAQLVLDDPVESGGLALRWMPDLRMPDTTVAPTQTLPQWSSLLAAAAHLAPSNRAAQDALQAARSQEKQAWIAAWLPQVNAAASRSTQHQTYNDVATQTPSSSAALSASWPLWRPTNRGQVSTQEAITEQTRWQQRQTDQQVALDVSTAYLQGIQAVFLRQLAQAQVNLLESQLRINDRRVAGGMGTVLDVLETRTQLEQARLDLQDLAQQIHDQQVTLERLTGQKVIWPDHAQLDTTSPSPLTTLPVAVPSLEQALAQLEDQSPQTGLARAQWLAAQASERTRRHEAWQPDIDVVGQTSRTRRAVQFNGETESQNIQSRSVGIELSWTLFSSGLQTERTREAAARLSQSQAELDDARTQAEASLRQAYAALDKANQSMLLHQQLVVTSSNRLDAVNKAFVAGIRDNVDVLNAQSQVFSARQNLMATLFSGLQAQTSILALTGQLDAARVIPLAMPFEAAQP